MACKLSKVVTTILKDRQEDAIYNYTRVEVYTWDKSYRFVSKLRLLNGGERSDAATDPKPDVRLALP